MTAVTRSALIDIAGLPSMFIVHTRLVVLMTVDAREDLEIRRVRMTVRTGRPTSGPVFIPRPDREIGCVIECGRFPGCGVMA